VATLSGSVAAGEVDIGATNPAKATNDRENLTRSTVDPTFRVEWDGFDTAVGKVLCLVEGKEQSESAYTPAFRPRVSRRSRRHQRSQRPETGNGGPLRPPGAAR
jgi:hypothetical protein